jgi:hypothetical protein
MYTADVPNDSNDRHASCCRCGFELLWAGGVVFCNTSGRMLSNVLVMQTVKSAQNLHADAVKREPCSPYNALHERLYETRHTVKDLSTNAVSR